MPEIGTKPDDGVTQKGVFVNDIFATNWKESMTN